MAKIAVTHASGLLAEALLERMAEFGIKSDSIILLDHEQNAGNRLSYGETYLTVEDQYAFDYENLLAVFLLEADAELESLLQHADCYVISHFTDKSGSTIFNPQVDSLPEHPCVIKLAPAELASLLPVIQAIHSAYGLSRLNVVNVRSAAFYGKSGVDELASQTIGLLNAQDVKSSVFPLQLAFNMIPAEPLAEMENQLVELLHADELKCCVQSILVAAFHGIAISVSLESIESMDLDRLSRQLKKLQGVQLKKQSLSPMTHCKTGSDIFITGLNHPQNDGNRLQFWVVADSARNGLIQNYLNILEILLKSYL